MTCFQPMGCLVPLVATVAANVGLALLHVSDGVVGAALVFAPLAMITIAVMSWVAAHPRDRAGIPLAFAFLAVPLHVMAAVDVGLRSIARITPYEIDALEVQGSILYGAPIVSLIALAIGRVVARALTSPEAPRRAHAVGAAALIATSLGALLVLGSLTRASRPTAQGYIASLPVVGDIPSIHGTQHPISDELRRIELMLRETNDACGPWHLKDKDPRRSVLLDARFERCGPLVVRRTPRGVWIVSDIKGRHIPIEPSVSPTWMLLRPHQLPGELRPPDGMTALAFVGVASAILVLARRRKPSLPDDEDAMRDAKLLRGKVYCDDFFEQPAPPGTRADDGPVVAILGTREASFRDHAGRVIERVLPGTIAEHRMADRVAAPALAFGLVVLGCTPLATALWVLG